MYQTAVDTLDIEVLATLLQSSQIMIYPTDTIPGIGCIGSDQIAVEKLFKLKQRNLSKPVSYAFADLEMMQEYVNIPIKAEPLLKLLPGKLTLVLPKIQNDRRLYGTHTDTLGCRIPNVPWLLRLIRQIEAPLVTTSANISGEEPVGSISDIPNTILNELDIMISWKQKFEGIGSTVIAVTLDGEVTILREGAISADKIHQLLN